jgi:hypothetical protein
MSLRERLRQLERAADPSDVLRVIFLPDGADKEAEYQRQRNELGARGPLVIMDETDRAL